jgi:hypothetical protein
MRTRLQKLWLGIAVAYALIRIALAQRYLSSFGLSIPAFAAIELCSSVLFGFASGRFVPAVVDRHRRHIAMWGPATLVGFLAPDLFAVITTPKAPKKLLAQLIIVIVGSLAFSGYELIRRIKKAKTVSAAETLK